MPFDINNPADVTTLRTEITTDPAGQGYAPHVTTGATVEILKLLKADSAGGETNTARGFTGSDLLDALTWGGASETEYAAQITNHGDAVRRQMLIERLVAYADEPIPVRFHPKIRALFETGAPTIWGRITTEATRNRRREEVVFGDDTVLTREAVRAALVP